MTGIFIADMNGPDFSKTLEAMNKVTNEWIMQAARRECAWICPDCCISFPDGMPDACGHDSQRCTDIIARDKADALAQKEDKS